MNINLEMRKHIQIAIKDTFHIWKRELKHVFKDPGVIIFFLLVPFIYPVLYALIYNQETVHEVKMLVVDQSSTPTSREFIRKVDATADVHVVGRCNYMDEAKRLMDEKEAYGILLIPSSFSQDIHLGKQTAVSLYCDMGALLYYKALLLSVTEVSLNMGKDIRLSNMEGTTIRMEEINSEPITYDAISIYNPQNGFSSFLVPGILILVIQQTLLLGIGMLAGTSREQNRLRNLIPMRKQYVGTLRIVYGKSLAYFVIYVLVCTWALLVVPILFNLPRTTSFSVISLFALPFLFSCIFFAMSASCLIRGRETPMLLFVFISVPLLFLSGISWPQSAIPDFWKWVSYIFPSTFGIQGFIKINSMGASLESISLEYKALWIQTGIYFVLTCLLYRYQLIRAKKAVHWLFLRYKKISKRVS